TSEIDRGSTFKIFFPVTEEAALVPETSAPVAPSAPGRGAGEVVLLVEDEPVVREMARTPLGSVGYHLVQAGDGRESLTIEDRRSGDIDLVLTDMVMPNGVSGGA